MSNRAIFQTLKQDRIETERDWEFCNRYILPHRGPLFGNEVNWHRMNNRSFKDDAVHHNRTLASYLYGGIFPKKFFDSKVKGNGDLRTESKLWLSAITDSMHEDLFNSTSKFPTSMFESLQDITGFGNGILYLINDEKKNKIVQHIGVNGLYWSKDMLGRTDIVAHEFKMRAKDVVAQFSNISRETKLIADKEPTKKIKVIHMVLRNKKKTGKIYDSCYYEEDSFHLLSKDGYYTMPYIIGAWGNNPASDYSYGPGITAKQDILMYQKYSKLLIQSSELQVAPPVNLPNDSTINTLDLTPHGVNYGMTGDGRSKIQLMELAGDLRGAREEVVSLKTSMRMAFFIDSIIHNDGTQIRSAQEVVQRAGEQDKLLGPYISNIYHQLVNPLLERLFDMKMRNNEFGEIPEELAGAEIKFVFTSPLAKTYELGVAESITKTFELVSPLLQAQPQAMENYNIDDIVRAVGSPLGFPEELYIPEEVRDERRQQQAEAAQQAQQIQAAQELAGTAANLQKAGIEVVPQEKE